MITILDFEAEPGNYIYGDDCTLHYAASFKEQFDGNFELLMACCADNAGPDGIDYHATIKDYNESLKSTAKGTNFTDMIVKVGDQISLSGKEVVITRIISGTQIIVEPIEDKNKSA